MANWNNPTLASSYADFIIVLKARDLDAATMFESTPTNPVTGLMRYLRNSNKFQEYRNGGWQDEVISIEGGGTGQSTIAGIKTALGIGANINLSNIEITGGNINGIGLLSVNGDATIGGQIIAGTQAIRITDEFGKIRAAALPSIHWDGTQAEYDALSTYVDGVAYVITD